MLQLFTMGPVRLNANGTPMLTGNGATIPNYTPDDIRDLSRALTGWTFSRSGGCRISCTEPGRRKPRRRSALLSTLIELMTMAADASTGSSSNPSQA